MTTFNDSESGASVRAKINAAISTVDGLGSGDNLLMTAAQSSKLAGIAAGAQVNTVDSVAGETGHITAGALRTAINVEDGATADQTGAEIKAAYEGEANTNAFTDAEKSKLTEIEAGADVTDATNVAAAGAVMDGDFSSNGVMTRTGAGTYAVKTVTGADAAVVTGTAGTTDQIAVWNADGDIVGATAGTIAGLTEKVTPASGDFLVLSDTAASGALKKVDWDSLPTGGDVVDDTTPTLGGNLDGAGNEVANYTNSVVTSVSGTLTTAAHAGNVIVTSGNVTVPTTAGFTCIIIAGGAHTVTFNSTTSAAMAAGDIMTVAVQSGTVIHAVLTAAADKVTFT